MANESVFKKRASIALWALILIGTSVLGAIRTDRTFPRKWATLTVPNLPGGDLNTDRSRVWQALEHVTAKAENGDNSEVAANDAFVKLAELTAASGKKVTITLVEGQFLENEVSPSNSWTNLGHKLILVNSVDQSQSTDRRTVDETAMAYNANPGCGVSGEQMSLEPGQTYLHECKGPYSKDGIRWLDNLAIVTYSAKGTEVPCVNKYATDDDKYEDCVRHNLVTGLQAVFADAKAANPSPDGIIFPAIATGHGKLRKRVFYDLLNERILAELKNSRSSGSQSDLPANIYLRVNSKSDEDSQKTSKEWVDTRISLAQGIPQLVQDWELAEHSPAVDWRSITGVSGALGILLLVVAARRPGAIFRLNLSLLYQHPTWFVVIGWLFASLGIVKTFEPLTSLIPSVYGAWPQVAISFGLVLVLVPVSLAIQTGQNLTQGPSTTGDPLKTAIVTDPLV
jgi:hypothetical protein